MRCTAAPAATPPIVPTTTELEELFQRRATHDISVLRALERLGTTYQRFAKSHRGRLALWPRTSTLDARC